MHAVSDWLCGMIGHILFRSGPSRSDSIDRRREYIQLTLPRTVLISPLWARNRYGCASFQDGKVLVENRWCTRASADVVRWLRRSWENVPTWVASNRPLYTMVRVEKEGM